jgi:hypothetical protein
MKLKSAFSLCLVYTLGFGTLSLMALGTPAFDVLLSTTIIFAMILPACSTTK